MWTIVKTTWFFKQLLVRNEVIFTPCEACIWQYILLQSDTEGNVVNSTAFSFSKSEYKLLNKNLNFIPTPKVYNKNELNSNLNNFFRLIKSQVHFKDSVNKDTDKIKTNKKKEKSWNYWKCWKKTKKKNIGQTPDKNIHIIDTFVETGKNVILKNIVKYRIH